MLEPGFQTIRARTLPREGWLWLEFALLNNTTVVLKGQTHLIQPRHFNRSTSGGSTFGSLSSDVDLQTLEGPGLQREQRSGHRINRSVRKPFAR